MTTEDRATLRLLIDERSRARAERELLWERDTRPQGRRPRSTTCSGCGCDHASRTDRCSVCQERHRRRYLRANVPAFNLRARAEVARYRQRRAERATV